jgi:hypothetical protein
VRTASPATLREIGGFQRNKDIEAQVPSCPVFTGRPPASCSVEGKGNVYGSLSELTKNRKRPVVVVGNSFMGQWMNDVVSIMPSGLPVVYLLQMSCLPFDYPGTYVSPDELRKSDCIKKSVWQLREALRLKPRLVIASSFLPAPERQEGLSKLVKSLTKHGSKVLWIGQVPGTSNWDSCLEGNNLSGCFAKSASVASRIAASAATVRNAGGYFWDLEPHFCTGGTCPAIIGGMPVRLDGSHLTPAALTSLQPQLAAAVHETLNRK